MSSAGRSPIHALQYRSGQSPVHRLTPWLKLLAATTAGTVALLVRDLYGLVALSGLVLVVYRLAGFGVRELWRDFRWLGIQAVIVFALTVIVNGTSASGAGIRTGLQIVLVFLPMALVVRTTGVEAMLESLQRWLPDRLGFAVGATLRFVPFLARELGELVEMQRLRGARLAAREIWRPVAWRDWLACVAMPMTLRAIEVAEEAADAATIRGIAMTPARATERTPMRQRTEDT